ncbi:MAG: hypothetical protein H6738_06075 [Alphaproteobacteria bacterium]|nr:hypothetical protein [Alphaproteobacteria bacterium]MCB9696331.1 hypothetical protein [Alphaproteobacteria bacterium]
MRAPLPLWAHALLMVARLVLYGTLFVAVGAVATMAWIQAAGWCSELGDMGITCDTAAHTQLAEICFGIFLVYAFTGFPVLLAMGGVVMGMIDAVLAVRWLRRRATPP